MYDPIRAYRNHLTYKCFPASSESVRTGRFAVYGRQRKSTQNLTFCPRFYLTEPERYSIIPEEGGVSVSTNEKEAACFLKERCKKVPEIAVVLGSGWSEAVKGFRPRRVFSYEEIPGFPVSAVSGHPGKLAVGNWNGVETAVFCGRVHYYEGYSPAAACTLVRTAAYWGVPKILLTNAAGGICERFLPGDLMVITDHISNFVPSPLNGPNAEELGPRFPDMSAAYDRPMSEALHRAAGSIGLTLQEGIYLQTAGPQFETPAEIRMMRMLGADAVGMSTAIETIAARHAGMRVAGLSLITNMAAGMEKGELTHEEVAAMGASRSAVIGKLLEQALPELAGA